MTIMSARYTNKYASIEEETNGRFTVYNDVTGLMVRENLKYSEAYTMMREIANHYNAVEYGRK